MAIHAHSTTAPVVQPRLLRGGGTVTCRVLTTDELLDEIRLTIEEQEAFGFNRHDIVTTAPQADASGYLDACRGDTPTQPDYIGNSDVVESQPDHFRLVDEARTLHFRRELHQALDYGFALLDALDLPPLGLDVIDNAIAMLDALDDDVDLEDDDTAEAEPDDEEGGDLEAVDEDGDPLDLGEHDGWRRPRRARVVDTEWPVAMAEREWQRAVVIAAVVTSPNVVRFPGSGPL